MKKNRKEVERTTMGKENGLTKIEMAFKKGKLAVDVVLAFKLGGATATTARTTNNNDVAVLDNEGEEETSSPTPPRADDVCDGRTMLNHTDHPDDGNCRLPATPDDDEKIDIPTSSSTAIIGEGEEEFVVERTSPNIMDRRDKKNAANGHEISAPRQKSPPPAKAVVAAPAKLVSVAPDNNNNNNMLVIGSIIWTVLAAYHVWTCMESIRADQFPSSAVSIFVGGAFLCGYNMGKRSLFLVEDEEEEEEEEGGVDDEPGLLLRERPGGGDEPAVEVGERRKWWRPPPKPKTKQRKRDKFKTILSHSPKSKRELKEWEIKLRAPFTDGPLMDHLLKISPDFGRLKKSQYKSVVAADAAADHDETDERVIDHAPIGKVELNDTRANALESHEDFSHVVDPMCKLRGMDLFLTDDPQEGIWRQPLLNQCGLRDVPTFVANFMMPFGNITAYFALPDWVDDLNNIPEEKDDDPPCVKAFKRFLNGDEDYRNARLKIIPCFVDGPLAIRLLKPYPVEVTIHRVRHPTLWTDVPKSVDPITRKPSHAILECDMDFISDRQIRRILNLARPHMQRITIDVAFVISKPNRSEIEEPSACLGLWRVDKIDFERCAVFPERSLEESVHELSLIMSNLKLAGSEEESRLLL